MLKKFLSLVLTFSVLLMTAVSASAAKGVNNDSEKYIHNEYDYVFMLKNSSDDELNAMGLTTEDAESRILEFENGLRSRANLPSADLMKLGYSEDEITLLHAYARGARLSKDELRGVAGTCTGTITNHGCSSNSATFTYSWEWDHCPVVTLKDCAAMRWIAYDSNGYELSVIKTSQDISVEYHYGSFHHYGWLVDEEPNLDFNTINIQFPVVEVVSNASGGITLDTYAKIGRVTVTVEVDASVNNEINYMLVAGLYGHTLVGIGAPSVSVGVDGSLAISFTGNTYIDAVAGKKGRLPHGTAVIDIT